MDAADAPRGIRAGDHGRQVGQGQRQEKHVQVETEVELGIKRPVHQLEPSQGQDQAEQPARHTDQLALDQVLYEDPPPAGPQGPAHTDLGGPGQELPQGTVLIMEDHKVVLDANENPILDSDGRLQPTNEVTNVFVMEKQPGWGAEYPLETRNGDWDYAWFEGDGSRKQGDFVRFTGCFSCHQNRANRDFTFTFFKYLLDTKG